jgi:AcrR family transcriptional regulator
MVDTNIRKANPMSSAMPLVKEEIEEVSHRTRGRPRDEVARARILEAALNLVEDLGFANITTDAIAERAGASKATIYRWWPNKAAVLMEALREAVAQESFPNTGDLREDIRLQLRNFIKLLTGHHGRVFKAFVAAAQNDPEIAKTFRAVWIMPRRALAKIGLERHRGRELRDDADLELVMDALYGPIYLRILAGHRPLTGSFTDALADVVLEGIRKR